MLGYMKQYDPAVTKVVSVRSDPATIRHIDVSVLHPPERFPATDWTPAAAAADAHTRGACALGVPRGAGQRVP